MIVTLSIDDKTHAQYGEMDPESPQRAMEKQLERFKSYLPTERVLLFSPEERRELERLYGRPIDEPLRFIEFIRKLVSVDIAGVPVVLNAGQVKRLVAEAEHVHRKPAELLEQKVKQMAFAVLGA